MTETKLTTAPRAGHRYVRRDGTITPPLETDADPSGMMFGIPHVYDYERDYVYSSDDTEADWAWRVFPGWKGVEPEDSPSDLMEEYVEH